MEKAVKSRQQAWQDKKRESGLCSQCGKNKLASNSSWFCEKCLAFKYYRRKQAKAKAP